MAGGVAQIFAGVCNGGFAMLSAVVGSKNDSHRSNGQQATCRRSESTAKKSGLLPCSRSHARGHSKAGRKAGGHLPGSKPANRVRGAAHGWLLLQPTIASVLDNQGLPGRRIDDNTTA